MTKLLTTLLLITTLLSCNNKDKQKNTDPIEDTTVNVTTDKNTDNSIADPYYRIGEDSVTILPFEIEVTLSPKAVDKITKSKETIIVDVFFNGAPKDSSSVTLEEDGSFFVTAAKKEIVYGEVAKFDDIKFSKAIYSQLADKNIDVSVNVYSGRKSSGDNLLDCEPLFDKIANVVNKKFTLKGKLIYGDN